MFWPRFPKLPDPSRDATTSLGLILLMFSTRTPSAPGTSLARSIPARQTLAQIGRWYHFRVEMMDASEQRLIEALKNVDAHGDVAPAHVNDPMTMVLRENAIQGNLMRWDDDRYRYVLTGTGRRRISTRGRAPGAVLAFRKRDSKDAKDEAVARRNSAGNHSDK